jgi:thioredoxin reductase
MNTDYDVLIVGGGPAGLSAALSLGRMKRSALICDDNQPRNSTSSHVYNLPSRDGIDPVKFKKKIRRDLEKYKTIEFLNESVTSLEKVENKFKAQLSNNKTFLFKKIILAHGICDRLPDPPGFNELWGKSVFHCPYCHGFEVQNLPLGIVSNGDDVTHLASMIFALSSDLIIFSNGPSRLSLELKEKLSSRKIPIIETEIDYLKIHNEKLESVVLKNGEAINRHALFITPCFPFELTSNVGVSIGCIINEKGYYEVSDSGETNIPGVYAAGDVAGFRHSVLQACASGSLAGSECINEIVDF